MPTGISMLIFLNIMYLKDQNISEFVLLYIYDLKYIVPSLSCFRFEKKTSNHGLEFARQVFKPSNGVILTPI